MSFDLAKLPGIKEDELLRLGKCAVCHEPMLGGPHSSPTFYKVTIARAAFDVVAINRRVGLQQMFGGATRGADALARVMGPNEDLAKIYDGPVDIVVHEICAGDVHHLVSLFPEETETEAARCRACGCTQDRACVTADGPCSWAEPDLCSACATETPR